MRILLIEDDEVLQGVLVQSLKLLGSIAVYCSQLVNIRCGHATNQRY